MYDLTQPLPVTEPRAVRRYLHPFGDTYIHPISWADAQSIKLRAIHHMSGGVLEKSPDQYDPPMELLQLYQVVHCCRQSPGGPPSFLVPMGAERDAIANLTIALSEITIRSILAESDALSMEGYIPSKSVEEVREQLDNRATLISALNDKKVWASLNYLCQSIYGKELVEVTDKTIGEVYNQVVRHQEHLDKLIEAIGSMMGVMSVG